MQQSAYVKDARLNERSSSEFKSIDVAQTVCYNSGNAAVAN